MVQPIDRDKASLAADNEVLSRRNRTLQEKVAQLEEVNNDLNSLLLSSEAATLLLDRDLRLRRYTPAGGELFAIDRSAIGRPLDSSTTALDSGPLLEDARALLHGSPPPAREIEAPDRRWFLQRLLPYRTADEPLAGVVVTLTDITASRHAEQRYRETLGRLKRHMDNSPVASMEWDAKGRVLGWSPAAKRIFGWTEQQALGRTFEDIGLVQGAELVQMREISDALFRGEFEHSRVPVRNRRSDGQEIWCEWYNSSLHGSDGHLVSVLSLVVDVTERQCLESSLRDTTERLAEADRRKNTFLALLGHELRNPLAPVRSILDTLALQAPDREGYASALQRIDRQIGHLERLVEDLLDVARVSRGAVVLRRERVELTAIVREALEVVRGGVSDRGHRLDLSFPDGPLWIVGDATRLVQVFTNLLDNAIKYTAHGGKIGIDVQEEAGDVVVGVADTGKGIAPEDLPWMFDVFSRGGPHRADREGGLGIGLALVRQLVELHDGRVDVQSDGPGRGAIFRVWLPKGDMTAMDSDPASPGSGPLANTRETTDTDPAQEAAHPLHVLVVDDEPEIVTATAQLLRMLGHRVTTAMNADEAREHVLSGPPDCVLLDIGLPDTDGVALAREFATWPQRSRLMLVALSGYSLAEQPETADLFDHCLLKPAGRNDFEAVLRVAAERVAHRSA
jgi:PAS domain S-box-containing protein